MEREEALSFAQLREILDYDPDNGDFTWRRRDDVPPEWNTRRAGKRAGSCQSCFHGKKYRVIRFNGMLWLEHRLAWLYVTGVMPDGEIDHINGNGLDNRIINLRIASHTENSFNRPAQANSASGHKGVSRDRSWWKAAIQANGKCHSRRFKEISDAIAWREEMSERLHGQFAPSD